jgi:hypothetical protein
MLTRFPPHGAQSWRPNALDSLTTTVLNTVVAHDQCGIGLASDRANVEALAGRSRQAANP